jgi:purine-binding chemotaxis protein CheW
MLKKNQVVRFTIGKESFGIDIGNVKEIVAVPEITRVPDTPDFVEGVINLRGKIVSVIDLRKRLRFDVSHNNKKNRILVTEVNGRIVGLIVDEVSEVLRLNPESIEPPPEMVVSVGVEYITGVGKLEDGIILLLDIQKVLGKEEIGKLARQEDLSSAVSIH